MADPTSIWEDNVGGSAINGKEISFYVDMECILCSSAPTRRRTTSVCPTTRTTTSATSSRRTKKSSPSATRRWRTALLKPSATTGSSAALAPTDAPDRPRPVGRRRRRTVPSPARTHPTACPADDADRSPRCGGGGISAAKGSGCEDRLPDRAASRSANAASVARSASSGAPGPRSMRRPPRRRRAHHPTAGATLGRLVLAGLRTQIASPT